MGSARAFGSLADLDLDFSSTDRPQLVTEVLAHCAGERDAEFWWAQPVSLRTAALLHVMALTEQLGALPFNAQCQRCGDSFEFELALAQLLAEQDFHSPLSVQVHGQVIHLRRATGADLRHWRHARPADPAQAMQMMLDSLLLAGDVAAEQHAELSAAIAEADPLAAFAVACQCPACEADCEVEIDLDAAALSRLQHRQRALLRDIHTLARHYGWSEAQILALPAKRRAQYLALIEQQHE